MNGSPCLTVPLSALKNRYAGRLTHGSSASSAFNSSKSLQMHLNQPRMKVHNYLSANAFTRKFFNHHSLCNLRFFLLTLSLLCKATLVKESQLTQHNQAMKKCACWVAKHRNSTLKSIVTTPIIYVNSNPVSKLSRKQRFAKIGCKTFVAMVIIALSPTDKSRFRKSST